MAEVSSPTASSLLARERRAFLLRKLHSLSGVVPVGVFLVQHLWVNARALNGRASFDEAVAGINDMPYLWAVELFGIILPLAFHALYGVKIAFEGRPNVGRYAYSRNWMYTIQRVTGFVVLAFLMTHLWEFRVAKLLGNMGPEAFYPSLSERLSATGALGVPWNAVWYLVGIGASAFHLANGLFGFCFSWGVTVSRRAQRLAGAVFAVLGFVLFALGANTVLYFATGARFFIPSQTSAACDVPTVSAASQPSRAR